MRDSIDRSLESGHTIRALAELRAWLDRADFWGEGERDPDLLATYAGVVAAMARQGVSEAELAITLKA